MKQAKQKLNTCLLLVNIGSPRSPSPHYIKLFLENLLIDKNVINLPFLLRKFLVNCIIIPFRLRKSVKMYKKLYMLYTCSPLLKISKKLKQKLNGILPADIFAEIAMLYSPPYLQDVLQKLKGNNVNEIIYFPMYPQYAKSTSYAAIEKFRFYLKKFNLKVKTNIINCFFNHPMWIDSFANCCKKFDLNSYDYFVFSYHSLPIKQIQNLHPKRCIIGCTCESKFNVNDIYCYKATCYETTRLLQKKLNLPNDKTVTCFQSNFGKKWLGPFTKDTLIKSAKNGNAKVLIFSPSFTTDCLETLFEIGVEYRNLFIQNGGKILDVVSCPNDNTKWAKSIINIIGRNRNTTIFN